MVIGKHALLSLLEDEEGIVKIGKMGIFSIRLNLKVRFYEMAVHYVVNYLGCTFNIRCSTLITL